MRIRAVVDVIEAGIAKLLISPDEQTEIYWPAQHLPEETRESDIVYIDIQVDKAETQQILQKNQDRIAQLLKRTQEMERQQQADDEE